MSELMRKYAQLVIEWPVISLRLSNLTANKSPTHEHTHKE